TFAAMGNRGQYIVVVPERQAVIVRRGWDFESGGFAIDPFTADVLAAVNEGRIP
ncbi:MAG: serine hydrolase, partial [Gammaproteobacteria bacterium]|nr:serine hydrolase [Gammaproteobacteria bacterium]